MTAPTPLYPDPSSLLVDAPPKLNDSGVLETSWSDSAVIVMTKNHPERLRSTLPGVAGQRGRVTLLDDSSAGRSVEEGRRITCRLGVTYHGRGEQLKLLAGIPGGLQSGLIAPLGTSGWTLGMCRNYALLLARHEGLNRFILMDDDIVIPNKGLLSGTISLLHKYEYVGARTVGLADDSVVGHIARSHGVVQYDYVTGQYLGFRAKIQPYYFPNVYNEDLVFLLLSMRAGNTARYGTVRQMRRGAAGLSFERAITQEAGEVHSEGCIRAALSGDLTALSNLKLWREVLRFRRHCLLDLIAREREWAGKNLPLLEGVAKISAGLRAEDFADFYSRYFSDLPRWVELQEAVT